LALLVKLQGNEPPAGMTATHVVNPLGVKLALAPSLTVYVAPGVRPPKVAVPLADMVVPLVEIVAVAPIELGPPLSVKVKLPVPPTVFLVTTIGPTAPLLKLQPLGARSEERRVGKDGRTGLKPASADWLTV